MKQVRFAAYKAIKETRLQREAGLVADRGKDSYYIYPDSDGAALATMSTLLRATPIINHYVSIIAEAQACVKRSLCLTCTRI